MTSKIYVQFLWHFHQPYYSVPNRSSNKLPWVRLHSIKSYYDMGRMLERFPDISCVVNFSGCLLQQMREYIEEGKRDTWWELTEKPARALDEAEQRHLLHNFFSIDWDTCLDRFPRYRELLEKRGGRAGVTAEPGDFSVQELRDLQVLFNLAWFGFSARQERAVVQALIDKGRAFTEGEKQALLEQQIEVMQLVAPLYRRLHHRGQIELSITPMYHPILPLIIDTDEAGVATPNRPRPPRFRAAEDAHFHVSEARTVARDVLGIDVNGMWPAEGAVSPEALEVFSVHDTEWIATDEEVLQKSRGDHWDRGADLYRPWRLEGFEQPSVFFRERGLSDQIGFVYSKSDPEEAVDDFVERVRRAGRDRAEQGAAPVISVILDGENPWEHYPEDGEAFLEALYSRLSQLEDIETTTPSRYLDEVERGESLSTLHAGSWIEANYRIWIGADETNRAWELLGRTREHLVERSEDDQIDDERLRHAWEALHIAEGSDWFWWYGEDFTSPNDSDFDRLFRDQLRYVYSALDDEPPDYLELPISGEHPERIEFEPPQGLIQPTIDGKSDFFYEWSGAGVYKNLGGHGSMFEGTRFLEKLEIGFDLGYLYIKGTPTADFDERRDELVVNCRFTGDEVEPRVLGIDLGDEAEATLEGAGRVSGSALRVGFADCLEAAVSFDALGLRAGDDFCVVVSLSRDGMELERLPREGVIELTVPDETFEMRHWMV